MQKIKKEIDIITCCMECKVITATELVWYKQIIIKNEQIHSKQNQKAKGKEND